MSTSMEVEYSSVEPSDAIMERIPSPVDDAPMERIPSPVHDAPMAEPSQAPEAPEVTVRRSGRVRHERTFFQPPEAPPAPRRTKAVAAAKAKTKKRPSTATTSAATKTSGRKYPSTPWALEHVKMKEEEAAKAARAAVVKEEEELIGSLLEEEKGKRGRVEAKVVKSKPYSTLSGEFYDISVPTYTNIFGQKYINCILKDGIKLPITKYIEELEEILLGDEDDKTDKRKERLKFLKFCNEFKILQDIFKLFTNLLNGGGNNEEQTTLYEKFPHLTSEDGKERCYFKQYDDSQKLLLTAAGGNIMIIFAQFLFIILAREYSAIGEINKFILTEYGSSISKSGEQIFDELKIEIEAKQPVTVNIGEEPTVIDIANFKNNIKDIANKDYSDFDFKMTPNRIADIFDETEIGKMDNWRTEYIKTDESKRTEGFLLLRCKSAMACYSSEKKDYSIISNEEDCNLAKEENLAAAKERKETIKDPDILLAAQTIQKNFFDIEWLKNNYILQKNLDDEQTEEVNGILNEFKEMINGRDSFENKFNNLKYRMQELEYETSRGGKKGNKIFINFLRCFGYLMDLYKKKIEIASQTQINVERILYNFGEDIRKILEKSSEDRSVQRYENIIRYLYGITKILNKYIEITEEFRIKNDDKPSLINLKNSFLNLNYLLVKDGEVNPISIQIGKIFKYLVTDEVFQNKKIIRELTKCYPEPCNYLVPVKPTVYSYLSQKGKIAIGNEIKEKETINTLTRLLNAVPKTIDGLRLVVNAIKQERSPLIRIDEEEFTKVLDEHLMQDEEGNEITELVGNFSDAELLEGVPNISLKKIAEAMGYQCVNTVKRQQAGGNKSKKLKKTKKIKKDKKTKKFIKKNKKTKKLKKNKKKNLKKSKKYRKKLENN